MDNDNFFEEIIDKSKIKGKTNTDIYKRYEELLKQSAEKEKTEKEVLPNQQDNPSPDASNKPLSSDRIDSENYKEVLDIRNDSLKDNTLNYDLFDLNFKKSDENSIYEQKKLVNLNKKQKILAKDNTVLETKSDEMNFSFQKHNDDINYQDAFRDLRMANSRSKTVPKFDNGYSNNSPTSSVDLKNKLYFEGYKIRTYQKQENENYYAMRYYLSNKLNKDCSIVSYIIMLILVGIMWLAFDSFVKLPIYVYPSIMGGFFVIPLVNIIRYGLNPNKRRQAEFNYKLTFLNTIMLYLIGTVACLLISFFVLGAEIGNLSTLICPLIYPMFCMLLLPIYVTVYQLLYSTKKYYIE